MPRLLLNTIALDPNRWTPTRTPHTRLADVLDDVAAAGFRQLEVWPSHLLALTEGEMDELVARMRARGIEAPIVGLYPALHRTGADRDREWAVATEAIRRAGRLGAHAVKMFAGTLGTAEATSEDVARSVEMSRGLAAFARDHGLGLNAEAHPDTLCDSPAATLRFVDAVEGVGVCFQPYDFSSTEQTLADYRALRARTVHVHLQGRRDGAMVLLEDAAIDYRRVLGELATDGFDGALSIEFVAGCVVDRPADFDLGRVLANARRDADFVASVVPGLEGG